MAEKTWHCVAYGEEAPTEWCFFQDVQMCTTGTECIENMTAERKRIFRKIQEGAALGDPFMKDLAEDFNDPDQLLNGFEGETR